MNSNKGDNEDAAKDLLQQYRNGIWTLLGFTGAGFIIFVMPYLPRKSRDAGMLKKPDNEASHKDEEATEKKASSGDAL